MLSGESQPAAEPAAPAPAAGTSTPPAAGATAQAPPPPPQPEADDALDLGSLGGAMVADRLRDPKALGGVLAAVAVIFFILGRRLRG
jgi:hypothetical protein